MNEARMRSGILLLAASVLSDRPELAKQLRLLASSEPEKTKLHADMKTLSRATDVAGEHGSHILRIFEKKGRPLSRRDIQSAMRGVVKVRELQGLLDRLDGSGLIAAFYPVIEKGRGRPPALHYKLV